MRSSSNEFIPLNVPQLGKSQTGNQPAPAPVSWFEHIAAEVPAAPIAPKAAQPIPLHSGNKASVFAGFRNVDDIVREERERSLAGETEPPEITAMRCEAEQAARDLIAQAYTQVQAIEDEARQKGYQAGYQQGDQDGRHDAEQTVKQQALADKTIYQEDIATFIAHIEAERQHAWNAMEPEIISMVFDLAKHVIKQEIEVSREVAVSVVRNALRRVADAGTLRIRVNAEDLQTIRGKREELLTLVDNIRHVEIIEDRRVGTGGCIVETDNGNIDARIETQLAEAASLLDLP